MTAFSPRPCQSCPYRRDVPSGVWDADEYSKLIRYDNDTAEQPANLFMCHNQHDSLCSGWLGCHGDNLLALRVGLITGALSGDEFTSACDYVSPVPLFDSGAEAADHGMSDIDAPGVAARNAMRKIVRTRGAR